MHTHTHTHKHIHKHTRTQTHTHTWCTGAIVDWAAAAAGAAPTNVLALTLSEGTPADALQPSAPRSLYLAFNPYDHPVLLILPPSTSGFWHVVCDAGLPLSTQCPPPEGSYEVRAYARACVCMRVCA